MSNNVIGLYSPVMGSGKSVVSSALVAEGYTLVKFAGPLKDMARSLLASMGYQPDIIERMVEGDLKEAQLSGFDGITPRHLMQTLGTDWGRQAVDRNVWVKVAVERINSILLAGGKVVVDDMRFPNEFDAIKELGGLTVRVVRPGAERTNGHASEGQLDAMQFGAYVHNVRDIAHLQGLARQLPAFKRASRN